MSAVERYEPQTILDTVDVEQDIAVRRLGQWATSAQAAHGVAAELVKTSFVPEAFRGKPYEATAAILSGLEMGLSPMASLRSFDIIQGQAAPRAITLRAVAQAHGHTLILEESTATRCRMRGKRAGEHEWQSVTWTMDRAKQLGVTGKNNWRTQPQAMLLARATSELARLVAADAILGIAYSAEEIADGAVGEPPPPVEQSDEPAEVVQAITGTKRMSRKKAAPPVEDEQPPPPPDDELPPAATLSDAQMKKLRATYGDIGIRDAGAMKQTTAVLLGLPTLDSHSTLTPDQASTLIEQLSAVADGFLELVTDDEGTVTGVVHAGPADDQ